MPHMFLLCTLSYKKRKLIFGALEKGVDFRLLETTNKFYNLRLANFPSICVIGNCFILLLVAIKPKYVCWLFALAQLSEYYGKQT